MPKPIHANNFDNGLLVNPAESNYNNTWSFSAPEWDKLEGVIRARFEKKKLLSTKQAGAELTFEFTGTAVGAYILAGPDAGIAEVSIDGGAFVSHDLYHKYSKSLHYPRTMMFAQNLERGKHALKLRMSNKTSGKGHAMRILYFVVNR